TLLVGCAARLTVKLFVEPSTTLSALVLTTKDCTLVSSCVAATVTLPTPAELTVNNAVWFTASASAPDAIHTFCGAFQLLVVNTCVPPEATLNFSLSLHDALPIFTLLVGCAARLTVKLFVEPSTTLSALVLTTKDCTLVSS